MSQKLYSITAGISVSEAVQAVVGDALTCCSLLHPVRNLKDAEMSVQCSLIQELVLYEFKLGHYAMEGIKTFIARRRS